MRKKILFGLSGSIACFKAVSLISRLVQAGYEVQTVVTPAALQFIGPATLEGLTGRPVLGDTFEKGHHMDHIHLNRWADLIFLGPATANILNKMSNGLGDDLWTTLFLAHDFSKPYLIAPAMNPHMLHHPTTQLSLNKLKEWGLRVLETAEGTLACGEEGYGRLMDPEVMFAEIQKALRPDKNHPSLQVLITSGGTREAIDGVRSITNTSTGRTGAFLADYFQNQGHRVTLLHSELSALPQADVPKVSYSNYQDLNKHLAQLLGEQRFDLVLHAAAVSDYSVEAIEWDGQKVAANARLKLSSNHEDLHIHLRRNPKILEQIKAYSNNPNLVLVGFKLTQTQDHQERQSAALKVATSPSVDLVVQNDLSEVNEQFHRTVLFQNDQIIGVSETKQEMAEKLEQSVLKIWGSRLEPRLQEFI